MISVETVTCTTSPSHVMDLIKKPRRQTHVQWRFSSISKPEAAWLKPWTQGLPTITNGPLGSAARSSYALIIAVWRQTVVVVRGCRKCTREVKHCDGLWKCLLKVKMKGKDPCISMLNHNTWFLLSRLPKTRWITCFFQTINDELILKACATCMPRGEESEKCLEVRKRCLIRTSVRAYVRKGVKSDVMHSGFMGQVVHFVD